MATRQQWDVDWVDTSRQLRESLRHASIREWYCSFERPAQASEPGRLAFNFSHPTRIFRGSIRQYTVDFRRLPAATSATLPALTMVETASKPASASRLLSMPRLGDHIIVETGTYAEQLVYLKNGPTCPPRRVRHPYPRRARLPRTDVSGWQVMAAHPRVGVSTIGTGVEPALFEASNAALTAVVAMPRNRPVMGLIFAGLNGLPTLIVGVPKDAEAMRTLSDRDILRHPHRYLTGSCDPQHRYKSSSVFIGICNIDDKVDAATVT